jgi:hypothetical protein
VSDEPAVVDAIPCILVTGNICEGFQFYGPFPSFDDASAWEIYQGVMGGWVASLIAPNPHPSKKEG